MKFGLRAVTEVEQVQLQVFSERLGKVLMVLNFHLKKGNPVIAVDWVVVPYLDLKPRIGLIWNREREFLIPDGIKGITDGFGPSLLTTTKPTATIHLDNHISIAGGNVVLVTKAGGWEDFFVQDKREIERQLRRGQDYSPYLKLDKIEG